MPSTENKNNESKAKSRRDFLKTAGKFAVYTPPALMLMNQASAEEMCTSVEWCGDSPV